MMTYDLKSQSYLWSFIIHYQPFNPTKHGGYKLLTPGAAVQTCVTNNPLLLSLPQIQWFMLLLLSDPMYFFSKQYIFLYFSLQVDIECRVGWSKNYIFHFFSDPIFVCRMTQRCRWLTSQARGSQRPTASRPRRGRPSSSCEFSNFLCPCFNIWAAGSLSRSSPPQTTRRSPPTSPSLGSEEVCILGVKILQKMKNGVDAESSWKCQYLKP